MKLQTATSISYDQTIEYLFSTLPMFSRIGAAAYKKDLDNIIALSSFLNDPWKKFKSIHVAGTNGKGSTSHMIAAVLQKAGYKTGLYTSPHLKDFRERIKINGQMLEEEYIVDFVKRIQPLISSIQPSFFEMTVAMAFEYFAIRKVDIAIIETGLGGRLDSTNIISPEISVITNIGHDHMHILGNTLQEIAKEKAGIIKNNKPVVIGESNPETKQVFMDQAQALKAPIYFADEQLHAIDWKYKNYFLEVEIAKDGAEEKEFYELDLSGIYQTKNIVTALTTIDTLRKQGWTIYDEDIKAGLKNTKKMTGLNGRWDLVRRHPDVILDVAHNPEGMKQVTLQLELMDPRHLHIIIGMVKDKDIQSVMQLLPHYAEYYFVAANIPRAIDTEELQKNATAYGLRGDQYPDVNAALKIALSKAEKNDVILVCGSVFLVGEVVL